jgi:regulator of sirC expression with transglutaminase-like and TPR domain
MIRRFLFAFVSMVVWVTAAAADDGRLKLQQREAQVEALFTPGRDLMDVKLAVDELVDPTSDVASVRAEIDKMAATLLSMAAAAHGDHEKLKVLRKFLYESGPWNGDRPFVYDMALTKGEKYPNKPELKLLGYYTKTRLGNCVTMPILLAILGRRMGLKMTLALAPFHVFVKFTDETGKEWNIEATSGAGYTRDLWYRRELPMSDLAVSKGTYLRGLSEEETKAVLASLLVEQDMAVQNPDRVIVTASVILRHFPNLSSALLYRGSAYAQLIERYNLILNDTPPEFGDIVRDFYRRNQQDFAAAEALGWTEKEGEKQ